MHIQPFCLASAAKPAADVWYHEVAVPSAASVQNAFAHAEELETRSGHVDFTAFVDFALRFTCLAYRRNAAGHGVTCTALQGGECVELQFSSPSGAHAVLYLFRSRSSPRLLAVLCFKGSTANLDDWRANLRTLDASEERGLVGDVPLLEGCTARVHPGWRAYLGTLEASLEMARTNLLPEALRSAYGLPSGDELSIWRLLHSERVERLLVVGHSLGGALAAMTATRIGAARKAEYTRASSASSSPAPLWARSGSGRMGEAHASRGQPAAPLLVTFGCPMVGDTAFVSLQNSVIAPYGGLRVFNHLDPVPSVGHGLLAPWQHIFGVSHGRGGAGGAADGSELAAGVHGGLPVALRNDPLVLLNPMSNHLQYVCDTVECFADQPVARARYMFPGLVYQPETASTVPPAPTAPRPPAAPRGADDANANGSAAGVASSSADDREKSWRERAGRVNGAEGYHFGDVTRSMRYLYVDGPFVRYTLPAYELRRQLRDAIAAAESFELVYSSLPGATGDEQWRVHASGRTVKLLVARGARVACTVLAAGSSDAASTCQPDDLALAPFPSRDYWARPLDAFFGGLQSWNPQPILWEDQTEIHCYG